MAKTDQILFPNKLKNKMVKIVAADTILGIRP